MARAKKIWVDQNITPTYPARYCSVAEARNSLPDILQDAYGLKSITGVTRYGRVLVAVVPLEAVRLLAGELDAVDEAAKLRIQNSAKNLLGEPPETGSSPNNS